LRTTLSHAWASWEALNSFGHFLPYASADTSRGDKFHGFLDVLRFQILQFQNNGEILICGDLNARLGALQDSTDNHPLPQRQVLDTSTNSHGRQLIDFLRDCDLVTLNGRFSTESDNFTVISTTGRSVVDYAIVQADCFNNYSNFQVKTMLDLLEDFSIPIDSSVPDHSLLCWDYGLEHRIVADQLSQCSNPQITLNHSNRGPIRYKTGMTIFKRNSYQKCRMDSLTTELETLTKVSPTCLTADKLETNYNNFYSLLEEQFNNCGCHHRSKRKPWWNEELGKLRKDLRDSQNKWIRCQNQSEGYAMEIL